MVCELNLNEKFSQKVSSNRYFRNKNRNIMNKKLKINAYNTRENPNLQVEVASGSLLNCMNKLGNQIEKVNYLP